MVLMASEMGAAAGKGPSLVVLEGVDAVDEALGELGSVAMVGYGLSYQDGVGAV